MFQKRPNLELRFLIRTKIPMQRGMFRCFLPKSRPSLVWIEIVKFIDTILILCLALAPRVLTKTNSMYITENFDTGANLRLRWGYLDKTTRRQRERAQTTSQSHGGKDRTEKHSNVQLF